MTNSITDAIKASNETYDSAKNLADEIAPDLYTGEPPLHSAHNTWKQVKTDLSYALGPNVHRSWTARLRIMHADAKTVTLGASSKFIASKIETQYADTLRRLWKKYDCVEPPRNISILVNTARTHNQNQLQTSSQHATSGQTRSISQTTVASRNAKTAPNNTAQDPAQNSTNDGLRSRLTFDTFVVGPSNELAVAVARQVASAKPVQFNPIVLHGANGMGKTHLLYAIENTLQHNTPDHRVKFMSAENFVSAFVASVRGSGRDAINAFKTSLRDVDLLIIDDVHFITDKPGSQEEFLHTLISLVDTGRQIIIAADRHPDKIDKASERLKSYLSSGLVCKIGPANYELRLRILDRLIARRRASGNATLAIPQNARDHLAARMNATPRDLEGAFNQIVAQSEFLGTPISLETVQETLSDSRYMTGQRLTVDRIQRAVCDVFKVTLTDMVSKRRARIIARPRQVAMYLCKKKTKRSLPDIGRRFGGRDHTTVMHAVKRIDALRAEDATFNAQIEAVEDMLKA
ncbi:MAG: chromosomal replication initiator protein DnaA [Litorimonas sp.]